MTSDNRKGAAVRTNRPETFRTAIEKAEAEGARRDEMVLRLTSRDAADLKRDKTIAVADISFAGGVMRFLGVKVVQGGLEPSALDVSGETAGA
jgi:hypothetical protein